MPEPSMPTPADAARAARDTTLLPLDGDHLVRVTPAPEGEALPVHRFDSASVWRHIPEHIRMALGMCALELCIARYGVEVAHTKRRSELMVGAEDAVMEALDALVEHYVIERGLVSRTDPGVPLVAGPICETCGLAATDDFGTLVGFSSPTRCWQCTPPEEGAPPS